MKDKNKKPERFNSSIPDEIPKELLLAYVDGELVSRENINTINFDNVDEVVLTHAIVGGY